MTFSVGSSRTPLATFRGDVLERVSDGTQTRDRLDHKQHPRRLNPGWLYVLSRNRVSIAAVTRLTTVSLVVLLVVIPLSSGIERRSQEGGRKSCPISMIA
jgi:hypothetical protein